MCAAPVHGSRRAGARGHADGGRPTSCARADRLPRRHESLILPEQSADLIKQLVKHNVVFAVQTQSDPKSGGSAIAGVVANLAFPLLIIGGLIFLQRRSGGMGGMDGMNPLDIGKTKSKVQMEPETVRRPAGRSNRRVSVPSVFSGDHLA